MGADAWCVMGEGASGSSATGRTVPAQPASAGIATSASIAADAGIATGAVEFRRLVGIDRPFPPHVHDYPVIGLVREGHRLLECNRRRHRLGPGQLLILNPGDAHGCAQEGAAPLVYDSLALVGLKDCPPLRGPVVQDAEAALCFEEIVALIENPTHAEGAERLEEALWLLIGVLAAAGCSDDKGSTIVAPDESGTSPSGTGISAETDDLAPSSAEAGDLAPSPADDAALVSAAARAMAAHLRDHLAEPVRLDDLAALTGLSKFAALRTFSAVFGLTPMRYLASLRVERARTLLAAGAPCAAAAQEAGFSDQAHLTRSFKERLGMTPGLYQRTIRSANGPAAAGTSSATGTPAAGGQGAGTPAAGLPTVGGPTAARDLAVAGRPAEPLGCPAGEVRP